MSILIFIIILVVLIVGHEFGHLVAAKLSGMKVPEFGIGFPPKLWGKKIGDTEYSINALPFGGFVKIVGEDAQEALTDPSAFANRPRILQAATLVAGPFANWLLAFFFLSVAFMVGIPAAVSSPEEAGNLSDPRVLVTEVISGSPAEEAGIASGDRIQTISVSGTDVHITKPEDITVAVKDAKEPVVVSVERGGEVISFELTPQSGVIEEEPEKYAIGIASALVGTLRMPVFSAIGHGFMETVRDTQAIFFGLIALITSAFTLSADVSNIAGPVGIAGFAGEAASFGLGSVLSFAALISINLAILNLLPFPALDGGRLAFLAIETVIRRPIPASVANTANTVGFAILILLMIAVTANDIARLIF